MKPTAAHLSSTEEKIIRCRIARAEWLYLFMAVSPYQQTRLRKIIKAYKQMINL